MRGGNVLAQRTTHHGVERLAGGGFASALARLTDGWPVLPDTPVVTCGMIGARHGLADVPYKAVPCAPLSDGFVTVADDARALHIIPGLSQKNPPDVMHSEHAQIAGFLALNPGWDGVICVPGAHSKWAQISAGEIVSFQTFMTGELFDMLANTSALRDSVSGDGWDDQAFSDAVSDSISRPERLAAFLFGIRAADLLEATPPAPSRSRLSGILIGAELAAARPYWLGQNIAILAAGTQASHYATALKAQGVPATIADAQRMTLAGLTAAYRLIKDST